jgi:hypothetical protein
MEPTHQRTLLLEIVKSNTNNLTETEEVMKHDEHRILIKTR